MSNNVGEIGIYLNLNKNQFNKDIKNLGTTCNGVGNKISSSFGKIAKVAVVAFSTAAIVGFGKECIDLGSQLSEVQNVVDVTFSGMSDSVNTWAKNASSSYGLSETMAKKYVGLYGSMASAFGFSEKEAFDMSTTLAGLSGDVASFYNLSQDEAYTKLKAVFSGETESLKDLGIVMTQSALDGYAMANGFGKTTAAMTEAEKVTLRYNFVLSQLNNANGDFSRTQDSWANQTRMLQLRFDSIKATFGQGLINLFTPVLKIVNSLFEKLASLAEKFKSFTEEIFGDAGSTASSTANAMSEVATSTSDITEQADNSSTAIDTMTESAEKAKRSLAGFDKLNVLSAPESSSSAAPGSPSAGAVKPVSSTANGGSNAGKSAGNGIIGSLSKALQNLYERSGFKDFVGNVQDGVNKVNWNAIGENCKSIFKNAVPIAQTYLAGVEKVGKSAFGAVGSFVGGVVQVGGKQIETLSGGIAKWLDKDKNKICGFITTISNNFSSGFNNLSTFFDRIFDVMGGSVDRMRPVMENSISELLSGFSNFGGTVGTIVSEGFEIATASLAEWVENDGAEIGLFFDNIQVQMSDVMSFIGGIFSAIGTTLSEWWNGDGAGIFQGICDMFTNIGTTLMNVYNDWIMPAWNFIVGIFKSAWDNALKPIFEAVVGYFGKVCDCIATVWNNFLSPLVNFVIDVLGPIFTNVFNAIGGVFDTVFTFIGDIISAIMKTFGGLIDFVTGVFSGNWEKAWSGICDFFGGIWDAIWGLTKGVINRIIDAINLLWTGIYTVVSAIVNAVGGIAGALGDMFGQDWHFSMPSEPPLIPKLAKGGIVKAPTLAIVGDNVGANTGDPEIVSPLSKLKGMLDTTSQGDEVTQSQMLHLLQKIYELLLIIKSQSGVKDTIVKINEKTLIDIIVDANNRYKDRHNGKSMFA